MPQMINASVWNFIHGVLNGMFRRIKMKDFVKYLGRKE